MERGDRHVPFRNRVEIGARLRIVRHALQADPVIVETARVGAVVDLHAAMVAQALADDAHVAAQRERYRRRREVLLPAVRAAGFDVPGSAAGLYLWATRGQDCWASVAELADRGLLVAPGAFYGEAGAQWVRLALTATDERVAEAARRLAA